MDLIDILKLVVNTPPDRVFLVAVVVLAQAYTIILINWKIRMLVEIMTTYKLTPRGKPYPLDLFIEMGVINKRPLD